MNLLQKNDKPKYDPTKILIIGIIAAIIFTLLAFTLPEKQNLEELERRERQEHGL